jgi:hypothetical protein
MPPHPHALNVSSTTFLPLMASVNIKLKLPSLAAKTEIHSLEYAKSVKLDCSWKMENVSVNLLLAVLLKTSKATASTVLEDSCLKTDNANKESQTAPVTSLWATWLSVTNANQETVS